MKLYCLPNSPLLCLLTPPALNLSASSEYSRLSGTAVCSQQTLAEKSRSAHLKWQWLSDRGCLRGTQTADISHLVLARKTAQLSALSSRSQELLCNVRGYLKLMIRCLNYHLPLNFVSVKVCKAAHKLYLWDVKTQVLSLVYTQIFYNFYSL